jgi:hypothetical protein
MLKFLHLMTHALPLPADAFLQADRDQMQGAADRARARLQERGLLEVELAARAAVVARVKEAREGPRAAVAARV